MHKSSLLEIIRTFTPKELLKFEDFVNSPYFNKNKNVVSLFLEIKKFAPEFKDDNLDKEKVWKKLFPVKEYNYGIMKNLIFDLNKLGEQYIVSLKFEVDEPSYSKYLLQGLFDKNLQDYFLKKLETVNRKFDITYFNNKNLDSTQYFRFRTELYKFSHIYHQHVDRNVNIEDKLNIRAANQIAEFFIQILKTYNDTIAMQGINDISDNPVVFFLRNVLEENVQPVLDNLKKFSAEGYEILSFYNLMFESHKNNRDEKSYFTFKDNLLNSQNELSDIELRHLHSCLINSYMSKPPSGTNHNRELIEIFDSMIDKNIIKAPGDRWIEEHTFSYYIIHCANVNDASKVRSFYEKYKNSINPQVLENLTIEINCILSLLDKNFSDALKYLNELEFKNFGKKILSKSIKIRILYEMNDYESFISERDTYNHFLRNNKDLINQPRINEKKSESTKNKIDIINNLFKLRNDFKMEEYLEIKDLIVNKFKDNNWLLEKIKEIEEKTGLNREIGG